MEIPTITSAQNRQIGRVRQLLARPRDCRREGVLIADGVHLVAEALRANLPCRALFAHAETSREEIKNLLHEAARRRLTAYPVLPHVFRALSPVETPQGILGVFERPRIERADLWTRLRERNGSPRHLAILDGVQDPTNVGVITRSGLAAGLTGLVTTPQTVDAFHHRALRASQGAAFHLPILAEEPPLPLFSNLRNLGLSIVALSADGDEDLRSLPADKSYAFLFGAEGSGLPRSTADAADRHVRVPMQAGIDSLGVAAAAAVVFFWSYLRATEPGR